MTQTVQANFQPNNNSVFNKTIPSFQKNPQKMKTKCLIFVTT
jgi:hypothetical protein